MFRGIFEKLDKTLKDIKRDMHTAWRLLKLNFPSAELYKIHRHIKSNT